MSEYMKKRMQHILSDRPLPEKKKYKLKPVSDKRAAKIAAAKKERGGEETEQEKWYRVIMENETPRCWETGEWIGKPDKQKLIDDHPEWDDAEVEAAFKKAQFGWHGSIAHVLPKSDYPSVATHPQNYMILKMWGGTHGQYDASWEKAAQMKVWPQAVKIINLLYPILTKQEKSRLMEIEVISQEIKPELISGG